MDATALQTPLSKLFHWQQQCPGQIYLRQPVDGRFREYSWAEVADQVRRIAAGLISLGYPPGSRIALLAKNSMEWLVADWAIMLAGHISVPIYATANSDTVSYVLQHSEARAVFVGKLDNWQALAAAIPPAVTKIAFPYPTMPAEHDWKDWLSRHAPLPAGAGPDLDEVMSIIYTSGSTGNPKGVVITYRAYAYACEQIARLLRISAGDRFLSYLPLAHITERVFIAGSSLYAGAASVSFVESLESFQANLQAVAPTLFISVPRLWTRFQMGIFDKLSPKKLDLLLSIPLLNTLIRSKIKKALGLDQARILGCGSAPISPGLLRWYERLGLPICEAWGMTENLAYGTLNLPFRSDKVGTIGKPAAGVELKLSDAGEIMVRGQAMMREYYREPEMTRLAFRDGYFLSGDLGEIDADGYVTITGRVKELFKTAKGKYVIPALLEHKLSESPLIEQVCVTGSGLPQPVALVVLAEAVRGQGRAALTRQLEQWLEQVNGELESHARLAHLFVMAENWSVENGLLTPTLKFRRHQLEQRFKPLYEAMRSEAIVWE